MFIYQRLILTKHAKLSGKTWKNISKPTFKSQEIHPEMSVLRYLLSGGLIDLPKKSRAFDCICHDSWGNSTSFVSFVSTWVSKKKDSFWEFLRHIHHIPMRISWPCWPAQEPCASGSWDMGSWGYPKMDEHVVSDYVYIYICIYIIIYMTMYIWHGDTIGILIHQLVVSSTSPKTWPEPSTVSLVPARGLHWIGPWTSGPREDSWAGGALDWLSRHFSMITCYKRIKRVVVSKLTQKHWKTLVNLLRLIITWCRSQSSHLPDERIHQSWILGRPNTKIG